MVRLLAVLTMTALALGAEARVGETSAECEERYGKGQLVEVSMQEAVVNLIRISLRDHQRLDGVQPRTGNQLGRNVPGTTYACAPGGITTRMPAADISVRASRQRKYGLTMSRSAM